MRQRAAVSGISGPAPRLRAWRAVARCVARSVLLLLSGRVHLPRTNVGRRLTFADGSSTRVYRETIVDGVPRAPCILVVSFTLRLVRGRAHRLFEAESLLNTPLFVGFPGMVSKLWCRHDTFGAYRGLYEWDGPEKAQHYASCLWRVLELVSVPGSIRYQVLPGLRRDEVLATPALMRAGSGAGADAVPAAPASADGGRGGAWWCLVGAQ